MTDKTLPYDIEAERAVLGSVLLDRDAVVVIDGWLKPEHFYVEKHGYIYAAMLACYRNRIPPDTRGVSDELRRTERLEAIGGLATLIDLPNATPTAMHVEYYGRTVERCAVLRQLIAAGGNIAALGFDERAPLDDTLGAAEAELFAISQRRVTQDFVPISQVVDSYFGQLTEREAHPTGVIGVPSGYSDLDSITGGLQKSDLIILAARPSVGKTSLALSIAYNVAIQDAGRVGIFSLEMSHDQLLQRLIAMHTGIDLQRLRTGRLGEAELPAVMDALGQLSSLPLVIDDTPALSISDARAKARRLQSNGGVDLLIVDYLQLMQGRRTENRVQEVSEISRGLKAIARELNIPLLALSQLSRAVEGRASHVPLLSDLRESGAIEQDADLVVFIHREELYDKATDKKGIAELHIAKHRNGPVAVLALRFDAPTTRFQSIERYRAAEGYER